MRNLIDGFGKFKVAHLGNPERVVQPFRLFAKIFPHLFGGAEIVFGRTVAEPIRVVHCLPRTDAQQAIVRLHIISIQVMRIVGNNRRNPRSFRQFRHGFEDA